jgi:uncharacterized membrane protein (UPF0182 family)
MKGNIELRKIRQSDCQKISKSFEDQGWNDKSVSQYERYLVYQEKEERDVIIATFNQEFAGYLTIKWKASGLTHKFRYPQDLYLLASASFQKYSLHYGVTPFFVPNRN